MADDDLWGLFGDDDSDGGGGVPAGTEAPAVSPARLPESLLASRHPFFSQSLLWPQRTAREREPLDIQAVLSSITEDIGTAISVGVLKTLELDGQAGFRASILLSELRQALQEDRHIDTEAHGRDFVTLADPSLHTSPAEGWAVGYLFSCASIAAVILERHGPPLDAMQFLDLAIINSCRMEDGSSRWEFSYLKGVVGWMVTESETRLRDNGSPNGTAEESLQNLKIFGVDTSRRQPDRSQARPICSAPWASLSLPQFSNMHLAAHKPVVIKGYLEQCGWKALQKWGDLSWWRDRHGHRLVPVESSKELSIMSIANFLRDYLEPSCRADCSDAKGSDLIAWRSDGEPKMKTGYISQHGLFHQLKETQDDFTVPSYARGGGRLAMVNAWIGTSGTVTHLHTDEHENFLAQVAGFKYVRICSNDQRELLYPFPHPRATEGNPLNWFSPVDAENLDVNAHPLASDVHWEDTVLGPGDMLFIPKGYWHYVRSLSTSVSVNFWF